MGGKLQSFRSNVLGVWRGLNPMQGSEECSAHYGALERSAHGFSSLNAFFEGSPFSPLFRIATKER